MVKPNNQGKYPKLTQEMAERLLKSKPNCLGCNKWLDPDDYESGTIEEFLKLRNKIKKGEFSRKWSVRLKKHNTAGGKKNDPKNQVPVCLDCIGEGMSVTTRISLPPFMWKRIDNHLEAMKLNITKQEIISNAIYDYTERNLPFQAPDNVLNYMVRTRPDDFDAAVKRNLGEQAEKFGRVTHQLNQISLVSEKLSLSMSQLIREISELLPEDSEDIFLREVKRADFEIMEPAAKFYFPILAGIDPEDYNPEFKESEFDQIHAMPIKDVFPDGLPYPETDEDQGDSEE